MKELKKYQRGGAAKVAKKMSELVNRSVKTGKSYTKPAKYKNVPTHSEYVRTKKVPKAAPAKKLTKKYSKLLNPPTSTKRVKIAPKKRINTYEDSKTRNVLNRNSTVLSNDSKKKLGQGFENTRKHQGFGMPKKIENFVFFDTKDAGLHEMGEKLKKGNTKWSKPKMMKGGSLRRSIKHK